MKNIKTIIKDNALKRIKYDLEVNRAPSKRDIETVQKYQENLTEDEKKEFEKMIPKINKLVNDSESKSLIIRKENPLMKIPIVKKIYEMMQNKKIEEQLNDKENEEINTSNKTKPRSDIRQDVKVKQKNKTESIVISDLHGDAAKWEWAKQKLKENPSLKLIILGDAMDRQDYGVEMLLEMQQLSEYGRVQYLPGNHDMFAYNYIKARNKNNAIYEQAKRNLEYNGGKITIEKLNDFDKVVSEELKDGKIQRPVSLENFIDWLGNQPIQTIRRENDVNYALAHAVFDTNLYNYNKSFCLKDALDIQLQGGNEEILKRFQNVMWYREKDPKTHNAPLAWPKDHVVVVGHTSQKNVNIQNINQDPRKNIVYVDCGKRDLQGFNLNTGEHEVIEPSSQISKQIQNKSNER